MKKRILVTLASLLAMAATVAVAAGQAAADPPQDVAERLQEYARKYQYPYSEVPAVDRPALAIYLTRTLRGQIASFAPGRGTTMAYLVNASAHVQELAAPRTTAAAMSLTDEAVATASVAGSPPVAVNMIYYGWNDSSTDRQIVDAAPAFLVNNSPAGPWRGNATVSTFTSAGIHYFEYIDGGYEGTQRRAIPNDLQSNLRYVTAAKQAGAYGIFLDEVSDGIWTQANYAYLQRIGDAAHNLGLRVVFNTGVDLWADRLMDYCDYVNSSEVWQNAPLTASQSKYSSKTWLLTQGVNAASTAASLTEAAWDKGIAAHYACTEYLALPGWLDTYIAEISNDIGPVGDFAISASPGAVSFTSGGRASFTITTASLGGFGGEVTLTVSSPPGLSVSTESSMPLAPPYSATAFTVTSSTPGSYAVTVTGSSGSLTHTASVSVSVVALPTRSLSASVSTDSSRYRVGQTVTMSVSVRSSGQRVDSVAVSISVSDQSGAVVYAGSGMTNSRGTVSFRWSTGGAARGTYRVSASASKAGYSPGSGATSFSIR